MQSKSRYNTLANQATLGGDLQSVLELTNVATGGQDVGTQHCDWLPSYLAESSHNPYIAGIFCILLYSNGLVAG